MGYVAANNAASVLAASITNGATTLSIQTTDIPKFPTINHGGAGEDYTYLTLQDSSNNVEIVKVTRHDTASASFTVVRGQDGTTARSWSLGDLVALRLNAGVVTDAFARTYTAEASETAAAASAAAAAASYDSFDDRYLGPKASAPTTDNDGNALLVGALYFKTTAPAGMQVWDGAAWGAMSVQKTRSLYRFVATAGQTTFSGTDSNSNTLGYDVGMIDAYLNGLHLDQTDYTASNGTSIVLASGAALNDELVIVVFGAFEVANTYTQAQTDALLSAKISTSAIGSTVQAYDADTAKTDVAQSYTAAQRGSVSALTDGATITPDFAVANNFSVTLGGNRTLANPTNITAGQSGVIVITQDGTGSRTLAFGSYWKFATGTAPTLTTTAAAVDVLAYYAESSTRITARLIGDVK